jgi:CarboxypepD_reg-like domain
MDAEYKDPVRFATILIVNQNKGTSSTSEGRFNIPVTVGDTIRFSSIGYESLVIAIDDNIINSGGEELMLFMIPTIYELDSVVVFELGDDFYLKRQKGVPIEIVGLPKPPENPKDWSKPQMTWGTDYGGGVTISGLLNVFDKKLQEKKRLERMLTAKNLQEEHRAKIKSKFNQRFVKMITGIDDRVILEFMDFCSFSDNYILNSSEYQLTLGLLDQYQNFLRR